jgi:hypothetical protein
MSLQPNLSVDNTPPKPVQFARRRSDAMVGSLGKTLVLIGGMLILLGALMWAVERFAGARGGGLLPGDFVWRKGNFTVGIFLGTSIALSILLTVILWVIGWLSRR